MSERRARSRLLPVAVATLLVAGFLGASVHRPGVEAQAAGAHPRLLFSTADVPVLRARAAVGEGARAWATLKKRLDDYVTSPEQSKWHLDPTTIGERDSSGALTTYAGQNQMPAMLTDLAFGYVVTGDPTYARLVIDSLVTLADRGWPYWDDHNQYLGAGDLLRGVALSFDWTYDAMTPGERSHIVTGLGNATSGTALGHGRILDVVTAAGPGGSPGSNWAGVTSGGAGLVLLAVQGETGAPLDLTTLLSSAQARVASYLANAIGVDGEGGEGYTYTNYGLHGALPFAFALARAGGTNLVTTTPGLSHLVDYVSAMLIPAAGYDGSVPLNDSVRDALGDELIEQLWAISPTSSLVSWLWERTLGPAGLDRYAPDRSPPLLPGHNCVDAATNPGVFVLGCGWSNAEELNILYSRHTTTPAVDPAAALGTGLHFADHGIVVGRTGWADGAGDVVSTFSASRGAAGHTQEDMGQFTLYGFGGDFAVDSGYGHNYSCGSAPSQVDGCDPVDQTNRYGQSVGHNLVLVDNDARTQRGARTQTTRQTIPEFLTAGDLSFAHADTRTQFPSDPPVANRDWLFAHAPGLPVLLVVGDQLNRDGADHKYNWQMHTSASNAVALHANGFTITAPSGAVLNGLATRNGDLLQSTRSAFALRPWPSSPFDRPQLHSQLVQVDLAAHAYHDELTVMALTPAGSVPAVVQRLDVPGANAVEATRGGTGMTAVKSLYGVTSASGSGVTLVGSMGYAVQGAGEALLRQGSRLSAYGTDYVTVTGGVASVLTSNGQVRATGCTTCGYRVYAPGTVTSVTVNGASVPWSRAGDHITF
jgi:hypothetical protein